MGTDHYIDSLRVDLTILSAPTLLDARDKADSIVDEHVLPAVESVVEEKGRDFDAMIPQLVIDVGRVRLQDLRNTVETALKNALEKYRRPSENPVPPSFESLQDYIESGFFPWENGDVPFDPFLVVNDLLKKAPDTLLGSVGSYSEQELASLLMAVDRASYAGGDEETVISPRLNTVFRFREAILARLIREYPETASVLTARLASWRAYRTQPVRSSEISGELADRPVTIGSENGTETGAATQLHPDGDGPENGQENGTAAAAEDQLHPKGDGPENRLDNRPETGAETQRHPEDDVTQGEEERQIAPGHPSFRYVEISLQDVPQGYSVEATGFIGNPDAEAPDYVMTIGPPLKYYRKVAVGSVEETTAGEPVRNEANENGGIAQNQINTREFETGGPSRRESSLSDSQEAGSSRPEEVLLFYRYVEVRPQDIPAGYPVPVVDYVGMPDAQSPEYIMSEGASAMTYYRKVALGSKEEETYLAEAENREQEAAVGEMDPAVVGEEFTAVEAEDVTGKKGEDRSDLYLSASQKTGGSLPDAILPTYRYIEIRQQDIPAGYPVPVVDFVGMPGLEDPEYVMSVGTPSRYYRKVVVGWAEENPGEKVVALPETPLAQGKTENTEVPETLLSGAGSSDGVKGKASLPKVGVRTFRYVEILLKDVPEDHAVAVMDYKDTPDDRDPEYIMSVGTPLKYYRKVLVGSGESAVGLVADVRHEAGLRPYRYEEIRRQDIPDGYPVVPMDYLEHPDREDPEYIRAAGTPEKYFRKVVAGMEAPPSALPGSSPVADDAPPAPSDIVNLDGGISVESSLDPWAYRGFELEVKEDRIPVSDAGLVLLHPFIGRMMEILGLVKEGVFVSPLARIRAAHLLRDLTGSVEPHYNHNLILEKILCGLPIGYVLPREWEPTEREKEEKEAVLQAVCDYWKPLSGSSSEALCASFILRAGVIERFQDTWTIRVEGHTIDILLDDLPWELSIIYLPWLEKPIAVEWQRE